MPLVDGIRDSDADGNGAGFKVQVAVLDDKAAITAADIQVV